MMEVKHWDRLPRHMVDDPLLKAFKVRLVSSLSNLIELKVSLLTAGGGLDDL